MMRDIMIKVLVVAVAISAWANVSLLIDRNKNQTEIERLDREIENLVKLQDDLVAQLEQAQANDNEEQEQNDVVADTCSKLYAITITVIHEDKDFETTATHCTNESMLGDALDELVGPLNIEYDPRYDKDYIYGRMVVSFYGYDVTPQEYYAIYIDDVYAEYGIDLTELSDGAHYTFELTGWS